MASVTWRSLLALTGVGCAGLGYAKAEWDLIEGECRRAGAGREPAGAEADLAF